MQTKDCEANGAARQTKDCEVDEAAMQTKDCEANGAADPSCWAQKRQNLLLCFQDFK